MPYASVEQVQKRSPVTLAPENNEEKYRKPIMDAVEWAQTWIDSRLRTKFADRMPFCNPPPDIIQEIAADLAAFKILKAIFSGGGESKTPIQAQDLFDLAQLALDNLLEGKMALPSPEDQKPAGPSLGVYSSTYGRKGQLADFDLVNQPLGHTGVPLAPYKRY